MQVADVASDTECLSYAREVEVSYLCAAGDFTDFVAGVAAVKCGVVRGENPLRCQRRGKVVRVVSARWADSFSP
jgi:hypothetical protein